MTPFPTDLAELTALQDRIGRLSPDEWLPEPAAATGGCFVCFTRGGTAFGEAGEAGWAAAVTMRGNRVVSHAAVAGKAGSPFAAGFLAAREGPLLFTACASLDPTPGVLLVNAAGRDHDRRAGMAVQIGWALDIPTVGVTHRPHRGSAITPLPRRGSYSPLVVDGDVVGAMLSTRDDTRPLAVSAGWRTSPETAIAVVLAAGGRARTPEPLRRARTLARLARAGVVPARETG